jgi:hypothetical protein
MQLAFRKALYSTFDATCLLGMSHTDEEQEQ